MIIKTNMYVLTGNTPVVNLPLYLIHNLMSNWVVMINSIQQSLERYHKQNLR